MEDLIKQLMSQMDKRFDQMDQGFEQVEQRFDQMDKRFEQVDKRFEQMDQGFDKIDTRFDKVENDIEELKKVVSDNQTENRSHFKHIESTLDQLQSTFQVVVKEINAVKIDTEFLSRRTGKHDVEINNLNQRTHN